MNFKELGLGEQLLDGLQAMGFNTATPIQEQAIPIIKQSQDLIACAQTGTGKTAAFLLPILDGLIRNPVDYTHTLILVPTRELAIQIEGQIEAFAYFTSISFLAIYGGNDGQAFGQEKKALSQGANIIVSTPGRLIAHLDMGYVKFDEIKMLVLDEADRMLDMGFQPAILRIL
ncbi:MAG: DEAD/DEAH box helicase, partial [Saprospiraceae bacterium]|nr:DEAD/DEAH box helicase [Saprospiraceae bacterium]